jgi:creatinine amidohydrolase
MSASPRGYLDSLRDMAENFLHHGFRRIVFVNGHGGNIVPAQQATFELRQKYRARRDLLLLSVTYWTAGADPLRDVPGLQQDRMGHACEWETSMILRLAPHLVVGDVAKVQDVPFGRAFEPAHRAWVMPDRSVPGHIGFPRHATAEKGEGLFQSFARAVTAILNRVVRWDGREWDA